MRAMSKAKKSNSEKPASQGPAELEPLSGFQKLAWWSVPAVFVLAILCAAAIGVLFFTQSN